MKNKLTLSSEKIAGLLESIRQNPELLLKNTTSDPDLKNIVKQCDPATLLPNAEHFLGAPGSNIRRVILQRKRMPLEQRSLVILCRGERGACVLKPVTYEGEPAAAKKAGEIDVGPNVYLLWESVIVEQYIPGKPIIRWRYHRLTSENLGTSLGKMLAVMHRDNLFYIDSFFPHLYLLKNGLWRLIDFGCAVHLTESQPADKEMISWFEKRTGRKISELDSPSLCDFLRQHDYNNLKREIETGVFPVPLRFSLNYRRNAVNFFEASYHKEFSNYKG